MVQQGMILCFKYLFIWATVSSVVSAITLSHQVTSRPRHIKLSSSTAEPGSGSSVTPSSAASKDAENGISVYRYINSNSGTTCILLKTDAMVEVNFLLYNLPERADSFIPDKALVDGNCKDEDSSFMSISWTGYNLVLNFEKTPGGERWYIKSVELTVSPNLAQFHNIQTYGKPIKLYHKKMLIPTPVGKAYSCREVDIDLETDEDEHAPPGLRGTLLLRLLELQPFMYKGEEFESKFECKPQTSYRDETAPIAVGSTLAIAVLMTVTGVTAAMMFTIVTIINNNVFFTFF